MCTCYVTVTGTVPGDSHFVVYGPSELALGRLPRLFSCLYQGMGLSGGELTRDEMRWTGGSELRATWDPELEQELEHAMGRRAMS